MKFNIGDKVRIRKDSGYHNINEQNNPHNDIVGEVNSVKEVEYEGEHNIMVTWPQCDNNLYEEHDLEHAEIVNNPLIFN